MNIHSIRKQFLFTISMFGGGAGREGRISPGDFSRRPAKHQFKHRI
jgi:hypothetical protein